LYPLRYAAAGFLRVHTAVLRRMMAEPRPPLCNTKWGRGAWPFFLPLVVPQDGDRWHYLGEDWAFSHRLGQLGITPLADASIRLWHWGRYGYGWEDAAARPRRHRSFRLRLADGRVGYGTSGGTSSPGPGSAGSRPAGGEPG
jgi:hypothetical protein